MIMTGHNFGSDHDTPLAPGDISPYDQSCTPGSDGEPGGNYLMYETMIILPLPRLPTSIFG